MLHLFSRRLARNYTSSSLSATTTSASVEPLLAKAGCIFTGDRFGGVTITFESQSQNIHWNKAFASILHAWAKEKKYRGVWLQLNPATNPMAGTVMQASVESGFTLHTVHGDCIVLKKWLPKEAENVLPDAPHHQFGVAGMVVNGRNEVLVIQERRGVTSTMKGFWKLPGGLVDPGENLTAAVAREVMEETGVNAQFHSIASFRETHSGPYGSTDLYAICAMTLVDDAYTTLPSPKPVSPHPDEIKACEWIPMSEFLTSPYYKRGLYGALLKTAAPTAIAAAKAAAAEGNGKPQAAQAAACGMREIKMKGRGGTAESMFYAGQAKL
jgi:8-oxo-dGTP pyrophosphatase MutT (NUDIX family)